MSLIGPARVETRLLDLTGVPGIETLKRSPLYGTSPLWVVAAVLGVELCRPPAVDVDVALDPEPLVVVEQADVSNNAKAAVSATTGRFAATWRCYR